MSRFLIAVFSGLLLAGMCAAAQPARELPKKELKRLLNAPASSQDHHRLAVHFEAKAKRYESEAAEHMESAKTYRAHPTTSEVKRPMAPDTAAHCDYLAEALTRAAKESRELAAAHEAMARK